MEFLNYHHLRYFWAVAREGGLKAAAARLHVSPPSISAQIGELEEALGERLFVRRGRQNVLSEAGQVAFDYASQIFNLGEELVGAIQRRSGARATRFYLGVADSFPKLVTNDFLQPVFAMAQTVHVICREGKVADLLAQLAAHRLDLVLADEPAPSNAAVRTFDHLISETTVTFLAANGLARALRRGFPKSLHEAPALLPAEGTALRRAVEGWLRSRGIRPRLLAEFEDLALMKVMAAEGRGFIALPTSVAQEANARYGFRVVGEAKDCRTGFYAITAERRLAHPVVDLVIRQARGRG